MIPSDKLIWQKGNIRLVIDKDGNYIKENITEGTRTITSDQNFKNVACTNIAVENTVQVGNDVFVDGYSVRSIFQNPQDVYHGFKYVSGITDDQFPNTDHNEYTIYLNQDKEYGFTIQSFDEVPQGYNEFKINFIKTNAYASFYILKVRWVDPSTLVTSSTPPQLNLNKLTNVSIKFVGDGNWVGKINYITDKPRTPVM